MGNGDDLRGNDGMWETSRLMGLMLRRAFTEMPWAPVASTLLALVLLCLGRWLWRRHRTVHIRVNSNGEITIEPIGRGATTRYRRDGIQQLELFANSQPPPSDPNLQT